ncbi:MAG TPA: hypothetical protein PLN52_13710 [Opitutaceae bacterium]|nr:hypothetical protein [Opitutaceae bacterium]
MAGRLIYGVGAVLLVVWGGYAKRLKPTSVSPAKLSWNPGVISSGEALLARGGGLSAVAADFAWIQAMMAWERGNEAETVRGLHAAVLFNPRPHSFWVNGARILAFDIASWRLERLEAAISQVPRAARAKILEEQARQALSFLARGEEVLGQSAVLAIESGLIHLHARKDRLAASACFRRAIESGATPDYVKTLLAELSRHPSHVQAAPRGNR